MAQDDAGIGLLRWCLGTQPGYAAIGTKHYRTGQWKETIFPYPSDIEDIADFIKKAGRTQDVYFCPTVLRAPKRKKFNVILSSVAWADLDLCPPDKLLVPPTVLVETSKHRHHAYWRFDTPQSALDAESINKRIAYFHAEDGCDTGGWDLTQYLRIPGTNNFKYLSSAPDTVIVKIVSQEYSNKYTLADFNAYPILEDRIVIPKPVIPDSVSASDVLDSIIGQTRLHGSARELFESEGDDWSTRLWHLEMLLFGAGFTAEEVFIVCREAACNKYARDNRPEDHLWEDVCRAKAQKDSQSLTPSVYDSTIDDDAVYIPRKDLLTPDEHTLVQQRRTIVEEYVEWASESTDAPAQYHEAGIFTILSALLAGTVRIPTSAGTMKTNLWFMTLGTTTISRKTTCMNLALSILKDIDPECILATSGSPEGILEAISTRPNRASIYHKDEFSGLLKEMSKKDFMSGSMEYFTQLYDSQFLRRTLRSGIVNVKDPIFIFYAGGIRDSIYTHISYDHIESGFFPRFVFVSPKVQLTNQRALGEPIELNLTKRAEITERLRAIFDHYSVTQTQSNTSNGQHVILEKSWDAKLEPAAWAAYNDIEHIMHKMAFESDVQDLMMPMMDRLAKSGLKMAVLIAASERLDEKIVVHKIDILHAFHYIERYLEYSIEVVSNAGKSANEMLIEKIVDYIEVNPGTSRSVLMRKFHLTSRIAEGMFDTIEQRGLANKTKRNTGFAYYSNRVTEGPVPTDSVVDFGAI